MSTPIANFIDPIRFLLGDHDDANRLYEDAAYNRGIKAAVNCGMLEGFTLVTSDPSQITPDVVTQGDYAVLSAKVAYWFASSVPSRRRIRTRAWSEEIGDNNQLVMNLATLVHQMESGNVVFGWQSYMGFLEGFSGIKDAWAWMTRLSMDAPWATVNVGANGDVSG
jgi:hypothetical protein